MSFLKEENDQAMHVKVGCTFLYDSPFLTPMIFVVRPCAYDRHRLLEEVRLVTPTVPVEDFMDHFGNGAWRLVAPVGQMQLQYDALVEVTSEPDLVLTDLPQTPVEQLPYDALPYTLPSRYCDSDLFTDDAWQLFGSAPAGWACVQAICDWVHANIIYGIGSTVHTSGYQAYQQRRGVCRDFAHIAISFCRSLNIPARYVYGYLPDIGVPFDPTPMDFHAWFEAYLGGAWYTFDARHNKPRIGRVVIGRGRDAVDVALTTSYGASELISLNVRADQVDEALSFDEARMLSKQGA
jgi:transglutaminase-like putative cysteine protease